MKELEQNIGPSMMGTFIAFDVGLFYIPIWTKMGHNLNLRGRNELLYNLLLIFYFNST